ARTSRQLRFRKGAAPAPQVIVPVHQVLWSISDRKARPCLIARYRSLWIALVIRLLRRRSQTIKRVRSLLLSTADRDPRGGSLDADGGRDPSASRQARSACREHAPRRPGVPGVADHPKAEF